MKKVFSHAQMEVIMLDYLNNLRIEHLSNILHMPSVKSIFPEDYLLSGSGSSIFWQISKYLPQEELRRKVKMLSHLHRQMYF